MPKAVSKEAWRWPQSDYKEIPKSPYVPTVNANWLQGGPNVNPKYLINNGDEPTPADRVVKFETMFIPLYDEQKGSTVYSAFLGGDLSMIWLNTHPVAIDISAQ